MSLIRRVLAAGCLGAVLMTGACTTGQGVPVPSPVPTVTVEVPTASASPEPTDISDHDHENEHAHGPVDPDATNEPTDAAYVSAKQVGQEFVEAWLDFGASDGYARDRLDRARPHMTKRLFYEQLDVLEDAGANADPFWQQLTKSRHRSVVDVDKVIPGYVRGKKAIVRVHFRSGIVAVDSNDRVPGVPAAATERIAILTLKQQGKGWKVDRFDRVDRG